MTESRFVIAELEAQLAVENALEELARVHAEQPGAAPVTPEVDARLREQLGSSRADREDP